MELSHFSYFIDDLTLTCINFDQSMCLRLTVQMYIVNHQSTINNFDNDTFDFQENNCNFYFLLIVARLK